MGRFLAEGSSSSISDVLHTNSALMLKLIICTLLWSTMDELLHRLCQRTFEDTMDWLEESSKLFGLNE